MTYLYYPGCSLTGTAREYDIATRAALAALGVELTELADWVCCGASAAEATSRLLSLASRRSTWPLPVGPIRAGISWYPAPPAISTSKKWKRSAGKIPRHLKR